MPVWSAYFGRNEISRRCRDMLREKGTVRADEISVQAMKDKVTRTPRPTGKPGRISTGGFWFPCMT